MVQIINSPKSFGTNFSDALAESIPDALANFIESKRKSGQMEAENSALERNGIDARGISNPKLRELLLQQNGKTSAAQNKLSSNQETIDQLEKDRDLEPGSLKGYVSNPKLAEQVSRPPKEGKKTQASQPIEEDQLKKIKEVRAQPGFNDLDEIEQYRAFTDNGVSKENADVESKLRSKQLTRQDKTFDNAYKAQEEFINDTTNTYKAFESETKPRLLQMRNIKDEDLISPTAAVFLDALGIPLGSLKDPSSELFRKLSLDLLKGLPETYGNRILKVEVDNFLKTIPDIMNSPAGRRMIASNMLKLGEMKEVYYNEMRKQQLDSLDNRKPLPKDFQQRVLDQVKPQIDKINNEFVKLSEAKEIPPNTIPFFGPDGEINYVPKENAQWAAENGGKRIW